MRAIFRFALVILVMTGAGSVRAADLPIDAFYGHWSGGGVAESPDSLYFDMSARDFDVRIAPSGAGFLVAWTTILRKGGTPENPEFIKRSTELVFSPGSRPGIYEAAPAGNLLAGEPVSWARIEGSTLTTYTMVVADDGTYTVSSYARTVSAGGMDLVFTAIREGSPVRVVKGKLVKDSD